MFNRLSSYPIWVFVCLVFSNSSSAQEDCTYNNRSVYFGERNERELPRAADNVARIFIDKEGSFYPDIYISDAALSNNCSSLRELYKSDRVLLNDLVSKLGADNNLPVEEKITGINAAIARSHVEDINKRAREYTRVDVLIHGFRKKIYGPIDNSAGYSLPENQKLEKALGKKGTPFFVEIYWDGKFITPTQGFRFKGFRLFEEASIHNANKTGLALRNVIPHLDKSRINIVTHSLGARVAAGLLFDAEDMSGNGTGTPTQADIRIAMIAPAIGSELFDNYYRRGESGPLKPDNYKLSIIFNENDFVLQKQYGYGVNALPTEYGNTSLGCNYHSDIEKLERMFAENYKQTEPPVSFDFSMKDDYRNGCHLLSCYYGHKKFDAVVEFLTW